MILKAYIKELPETGENSYKVRVPYLEDTTGMEIVLEALLCNEPGVYSGYKVGDCVFIAFEGDKYNDPNFPVIIGKLYIDSTEDVDTTIIVNNLKIKNKVDLPENTSIGGYNATDFFKLYQMSKLTGGGDINYKTISIIEDEV